MLWPPKRRDIQLRRRKGFFMFHVKHPHLYSSRASCGGPPMWVHQSIRRRGTLLTGSPNGPFQLVFLVEGGRGVGVWGSN